MPRRTSKLETLAKIADLAGPGVCSITAPGKGWPSSASIKLSDGLVPVALHVGAIDLSHRGRDDVERRFQNPGKGKPVQAPAGSVPLLLGLWHEPPRRPVLVAMDAYRRIGRETRQSMFFPLSLLLEASETGWADRISASGERIFGFHPELLPSYVEMVRHGVVHEFASSQMVDVVTASGLLHGETEPPAERARRASMALVRNAAFARDVVSAYGGFCALCGLDSGLVQGAHIYPAHAPGSPDVVWNGVALCSNHHVAFDQHAIWIDPASRQVTLRDDLRQTAERSEACRAFVATTFDRLGEPMIAKQRPQGQMFEKRYEVYADRYKWVEGA